MRSSELPTAVCVGVHPTQVLTKSLEGERTKLARALEEAKKRMAKASKGQHAAEVAAAEVRRDVLGVTSCFSRDCFGGG